MYLLVELYKNNDSPSCVGTEFHASVNNDFDLDSDCVKQPESSDICSLYKRPECLIKASYRRPRFFDLRWSHLREY